MNDFPDFMKNMQNHINTNQQNTKDIDGYYFTGNDGSQMALDITVRQYRGFGEAETACPDQETDALTA